MLQKNCKMIEVRAYKEYAKEFLETKGIDDMCMVVSEKHLSKKLPKCSGDVIAFVYPSADSLAGSSVDDDGKEVMGLLFLLRKVSPGNEDDEEEFESYEDLQNKLLAVEKKMKFDYSNGHEVMQRLVVDSIHIDPEYQTFGGYNGWSMSFKLNWY